MLFLLKKGRDNQFSGQSNRKGREVGPFLRTSRKISEKKRQDGMIGNLSSRS
jgi:hypothetical protein